MPARWTETPLCDPYRASFSCGSIAIFIGNDTEVRRIGLMKVAERSRTLLHQCYLYKLIKKGEKCEDPEDEAEKETLIRTKTIKEAWN